MPGHSLYAFKASGLGMLLAAFVLIPLSGINGMAKDLQGLRLELVSEQSAIVPGEVFNVGLMIHHEPGYHTYWKQPGIVGVPTALRWELPQGFEAGELLYPGPEITHMFNIRAQGFERPVLLQTRIKAPRGLQPGSKVTLRAQASWMCCAKTCHPGQTALSLSLPVALTAQPSPRWQPVFAAERARFAKPSESWHAEASQGGLAVTLTLTPKGPEARSLTAEDLQDLHFFTLDGWINTDSPQEFTLNDQGGVNIRLCISEVYLGGEAPRALQGVVGRGDKGWLRHSALQSLQISAPLRRTEVKAGS